MRTYAVVLAAAATLLSAFHLTVQAHVDEVERLTARQCLQEDWPLAQAPAHREWCAHNGYPLP